jgi:hypothetical protein
MKNEGVWSAMILIGVMVLGIFYTYNYYGGASARNLDGISFAPDPDDQCIENVCSQNSECCDVEWDEYCDDQAADICRTQGCVDSANEFEEALDSCEDKSDACKEAKCKFAPFYDADQDCCDSGDGYDEQFCDDEGLIQDGNQIMEDLCTSCRPSFYVSEIQEGPSLREKLFYEAIGDSQGIVLLQGGGQCKSQICFQQACAEVIEEAWEGALNECGVQPNPLALPDSSNCDYYKCMMKYSLIQEAACCHDGYTDPTCGELQEGIDDIGIPLMCDACRTSNSVSPTGP